MTAEQIARISSLSLRDGEHGLTINCWDGRDPRNLLAELRRRGSIGRSRDDSKSTPIGVRTNSGDDVARRIAIARRIWDAMRFRQVARPRRLLSRRAWHHPTRAAFTGAGRPRCGARAAFCGAAMVALTEGRRVRIAMSPEPGTDFNDVFLERSFARITEARDVAA